MIYIWLLTNKTFAGYSYYNFKVMMNLIFQGICNSSNMVWKYSIPLMVKSKVLLILLWFVVYIHNRGNAKFSLEVIDNKMKMFFLSKSTNLLNSPHRSPGEEISAQHHASGWDHPKEGYLGQSVGGGSLHFTLMHFKFCTMCMCHLNK